MANDLNRFLVVELLSTSVIKKKKFSSCRFHSVFCLVQFMICQIGCWLVIQTISKPNTFMIQNMSQRTTLRDENILMQCLIHHALLISIQIVTVQADHSPLDDVFLFALLGTEIIFLDLVVATATAEVPGPIPSWGSVIGFFHQ